MLHIGGTGAPAIPTQRTGTISGLSTASVGTNLSLQGEAPPGAVTVEGSYDAGGTWSVLSTVASSEGTYVTQFPLTQRGELAIKILFADGSTANGSIVVR